MATPPDQGRGRRRPRSSSIAERVTSSRQARQGRPLTGAASSGWPAPGPARHPEHALLKLAGRPQRDGLQLALQLERPLDHQQRQQQRRRHGDQQDGDDLVRGHGGSPASGPPGQAARSISPAAPMPPPMHIVTTA